MFRLAALITREELLGGTPGENKTAADNDAESSASLRQALDQAAVTAAEDLAKAFVEIRRMECSQ